MWGDGAYDDKAHSFEIGLHFRRIKELAQLTRVFE